MPLRAPHLFPKIDTEASARKAAIQGVLAAAFMATYALVTTIFALELRNGIDCLLYGIVAWRIYRCLELGLYWGVLVF
jgi:hypothetical protein